MQLCPKEVDKAAISQLGLLAQRRLARGVKLNHAEATVSAGNMPRCGGRAARLTTARR